MRIWLMCAFSEVSTVVDGTESSVYPNRDAVQPVDIEAL